METSTPSVSRNMLFVSHANPEDNLFARWLALRLAREGYPVWCDLTKLLGGEDFWRDIEAAIRDRTIRFLFVLSKTSNQKQGTLDELAVARKVGKQIHDFIIPLRIDDIRSDDVTIELNRLNYIDFSKGWPSGYKQLVEKLEQDGIGHDPRFSPDAVTKWWRGNYPATEGVNSTPERCLSNWFEFSRSPSTIRLHSIEPVRRFEEANFEWPVPTHRLANCLITFAGAEELAASLAEHQFEIVNTLEMSVGEFRDHGLLHPKIERREARSILTALFRDGFERFAVSKGLLPYALSGGAKYFWFKKDLIQGDKIFFTNATGQRSWRAMIGLKSLMAKPGETPRIRNWHFGLQVRPYSWPFNGVAVRPHVAFTENGVLYESKAKQHAARRSQCKSWYNDDWLDRILAAMTFLGGANGDELLIPLSNNETLGVKRLPLLFESPVSYRLTEDQPMEVPAAIDHDDAADEEHESEEEDDAL